MLCTRSSMGTWTLMCYIMFKRRWACMCYNSIPLKDSAQRHFVYLHTRRETRVKEFAHLEQMVVNDLLQLGSFLWRQRHHSRGAPLGTDPGKHVVLCNIIVCVIARG